MPPAPADRAARKQLKGMHRCQSAGHLRAKPPDGSQKAGGSHAVVAQPLGLSWAAGGPPDGKTSDATNETWAAECGIPKELVASNRREAKQEAKAAPAGQPRRPAKAGSQDGKPRRKAKAESQGRKPRREEAQDHTLARGKPRRP